MLHLPSNRSDGKRRHKATLNPPKKRSHQHLTTLNKLHTPSQAVEVQMACCLVANWISCVSDGILSKSSVDVQAAGLDLLSIFSIPKHYDVTRDTGRRVKARLSGLGTNLLFWIGKNAKHDSDTENSQP